MTSADKIAWSIVAAGVAISFALYDRPTTLRYEAFRSGNGVMRLDKSTGVIVGCTMEQCMEMLGPHEDVLPNPHRKTFLEKALQNRSNPQN